MRFEEYWEATKLGIELYRIVHDFSLCNQNHFDSEALPLLTEHLACGTQKTEYCELKSFGSE